MNGHAINIAVISNRLQRDSEKGRRKKSPLRKVLQNLPISGIDAEMVGEGLDSLRHHTDPRLGHFSLRFSLWFWNMGESFQD